VALAVADAGIEVGLWASDQSAKITPLLPASSPVHRIVGKESDALDQFGELDILHDNGIWLPHNHRLAGLAERHGILRVVSTRGMLEPWALSHKRVKKKIAWWLYQYRDLKLASCHVATGEAEARNLRRLGFEVPIATVPNGVDIPEESSSILSAGFVKTDRNAGKRTALFLGRIYPIKGLPMLVEAWARVRPEGWQLLIAGPDEARHQSQVERAVSAAGLTESVFFAGPIDPQTKSAVLCDADLFVLPSYSESFGMAVAEALAHGVPVLTTSGTPWSMLQERGCGWWVDATVDGISEGIRKATGLDSEALQAMGRKGRAFIAAEFGWKSIANRMLSTYEEVLGRRDGGRNSEIVATNSNQHEHSGT
jgi:glycosyltransferase involved in cell wall biosynthesis